MTGEELAQAAKGLIGSPFRLHGRDPATGLDCIGLLQAAMAAAGRPLVLPNGYTLRQRQPPDLAGIARICGFSRIVPRETEAGDVIMLRPSACQVHLAIATGGHAFVHAHAGLGKVALSPLLPPWPVISHWRLDH